MQAAFPDSGKQFDRSFPKRVYSAGELEFETAKQRRGEGIPLNDETLGDISQIASDLGVEVGDCLEEV